MAGQSHGRAVYRRASTATLILVAVASCGGPYSGDGSLTDRGWRAATDRYVLDLGPIGRGGDPRDYKLEGLPRERFTLGLELRGLSQAEARERSRLHGIEVSLDLRLQEGETVFRHDSMLEDWVWSCGVEGCDDAFAYLRGPIREIPLPEGGVRREALSGPVDGAWGTYFTARSTAIYCLQVRWSAVAGEPVELREARIIGRGGGWK